MTKIERPDLTPEEFQKLIPSLSMGQVTQFRENRLEKNPEEKKPFSAFIAGMNSIPQHPEYIELFARRALSGILIEGEPLDLSRRNEDPKMLVIRNER